MDTLGSSEFEPAIEAAALKALHDWGRPRSALEDLKQDLWVWYLARPSTQAFLAKATTDTGKRNTFIKAANQILSEQQLESNVFRGQELYSVEGVESWLDGESTNKYLGNLIQEALGKLNDQNSDFRESIRKRFEEGVVPSRSTDTTEYKRLWKATKALTSHVNAIAIEHKQGEKQNPARAAGSGRRGRGSYSDPTADLALGLIQSGDDPLDLYDGGTTTMREEFDQQTLPIGPAGPRQDSPLWAGLDLFEVEINDRTDMYRAQVFPDLYPDEEPMLVENWHPEDREAYCGGEYTPGYRRLKVVR